MTLTLHKASLCHGKTVKALHEIDLSVSAGERVALIGPSGAGKSSLLNLVASALEPSSGTVHILGEDPWSISSGRRQALRARIGLVHQSPPIPPRQRVVTAVSAGRLGQWGLARALLNLLHPLDANGARDALAELDLGDKLFAQCGQLSGGQLQRVGIARVLYQRPDLLLADEPVSAMDPVLADHTLAVLCRHAERLNLTFVASLHNVELALSHFPRVVGLRGGTVLFDCAAAEVTEGRLKALYANEHLSTMQSLEPMAAPVHIPRC
ncbi:phosphonate ABC transporter ATP-binding protein [Pseudomonas sp. Marseille-QA0892]